MQQPNMQFPEVIDNTMRKSFVTCPTLFMRRHCQNLRPLGLESEHLTFGGAFAKGIEVARKMFFTRSDAGAPPLSAQSSVNAGIGAALTEWGDAPGAGNKTRDRLIGALRYYFEQWPLGGDGLTPIENGIECRFDIPIPVNHPVTGDFLRYAGRYDMAATDRNGRVYVVDEKTASRLGDTWAWQWDLDAQMTGYIWSLQHRFLQEDPAFGTVMPEMMPEIMAQIRAVSILKSGYGHMEVPIVRSAWMVARWYEQMLRDVRRMVQSYERGEWDQALHSSSCVGYNRPCDYTPLCLSPNPERLIEGQFQEVVWNPIAKD